MAIAMPTLLEVLDLETLDANLFRGVSRDLGGPRVYGGQVIAQALVAANRTVPELLPHSLHAYFLRPGDAERPIIYEVDRVRDGRSFATRGVQAIQSGAPILSMMASFHRLEQGIEHQLPMPDVRIISAEENQTLAETMYTYTAPDGDGVCVMAPTGFPLEFRLVPRDPAQPLRHSVWFRATGEINDDPLVHRCIVAYASDFELVSAACRPHGFRPGLPGSFVASIDHAIWFHREVRADSWLLHTMDSPSAQSARGFARGLIYDQQGRLVASTTQEGVVRFKSG